MSRSSSASLHQVDDAKLTTKESINHRRVSLLVLCPRLFGAYLALSYLPLDNWCLFVLQCGEYVSEELVAIVLEHGAELIINLLLNQLWRYYYYLARSPFPISLVGVSLIVFLEPGILIKPGECKGEFEAVADPCRLRMRKLFLEGKSDEVISQLVYGQEALEAGVHIAIVGVVLEADYAFGELG
jgi:hypothetical protein